VREKIGTANFYLTIAIKSRESNSLFKWRLNLESL